MAYVAVEQFGPIACRRPTMHRSSHCLDDGVPVPLHQLGVADSVGEGDDSLGSVLRVDGARDTALSGGGSGIGQAVPAASEADCFVDAEWPIVVDHDAVVGIEHRILGHRDDQHFVVGEVAALDSVAERHAVQLRPVDARIVHGEDVEVALVLIGSAPGCLGVHARRRRHIEALVGTHALRVVNEGVRGDRSTVCLALLRCLRVLDAGGAVGLVAEHEIEGGNLGVRAVSSLRVSDEAERLVGAEHDGHRVRIAHG